MNDVLKNYRPGAIWKTREDIWAWPDNSKTLTDCQKIKKNNMIFVIKIIEDFRVTHVKFLFNKQVFYILDIEDVSLTFHYNEEKVF